VGINANVERDDLPPGVAPNATTLRSLRGSETELDVLLHLLTRNVMKMLDTRRLDDSQREEASTCLFGIDMPITIQTVSRGGIEGMLRGVTENGLVIVEREGVRSIGVLTENQAS